MALWSKGKSPNTASTEDHSNAYRAFRQREEKAFQICSKCKFMREKELTFNNYSRYICSKIEPTRNESGSIVGALNSKSCTRSKKR
jgi:hypothetical protein